MFYLVLLIDIDILERYNLKVYIMFYIFIFICIQCNFIYILNIKVLVICNW